MKKPERQPRKERDREEPVHERGTSDDKNGNINSTEKQQIVIAERRRQVASLLAQSRTEAEIATALGVNQSTISRDVQALKEDSGRFLHDLAQSDLVFSYQQSIRSIDEVKKKLWDKVNSDTGDFGPREKLIAFRLIMIAEETRFRLLEKGPLLLGYQTLVEKVNGLEDEANTSVSGRQTSDDT